MEKKKIKIASNYEEFVLNNRIKTNFALNILLWITVLTGPALAIGITAGIYNLMTYQSVFLLTMLLIVLAAAHFGLCRIMPKSIFTGLFALFSFDVAIVFLIHSHANITMSLFWVPLVALFFCDRRLYLFMVIINYLIMMCAEWEVAGFNTGLRMDFAVTKDWFVYVASGYAIETFMLGAVGYVLCLAISNYFRRLYDAQSELIDKEHKISEQLEILNSISDIYGYIAIVDLNKKQITNINSTGQALETLEVDESGYSDMNRGIIPILDESDVEEFMEFTNLNTLAERMMNRVVIYKEFNSRLIGWFRAQYIAVTGFENEYIYTIQDIDDVKTKEESLVKISNTDELTGLSNRRAYEEATRILDEKELSDTLVLFSVDINGLKHINDNYGHNAGDEIIIGAADCIREALAGRGEAFRTGGDEFQILIDTEEDPDEIKFRILEAAGRWKGEEVTMLAMSVGYAAAKDYKGYEIESLEKRADEYMYQEKNRYYREKGVDRRGQKVAYDMVCDTYTKILRVNLTTDKYQIIKTPNDEKTEDKGFAGGISEWLKNFGQTGQVHPDDLENYLKYTDSDYLKDYFDKGNKSISIFYKRRIENDFRQVVMEMISSNEYRSDYQEVFLYVKDIDR